MIHHVQFHDPLSRYSLNPKVPKPTAQNGPKLFNLPEPRWTFAALLKSKAGELLGLSFVRFGPQRRHSFLPDETKKIQNASKVLIQWLLRYWIKVAVFATQDFNTATASSTVHQLHV